MKRIILLSLSFLLIACNADYQITPRIIPPSGTPSSIIDSQTQTTALPNRITPTIQKSPRPIFTPTQFPTPTKITPSQMFTPTENPMLIPSSWIAWSGQGGESSVGIIRTDGSGLLGLKSCFAFCQSISWSPDGHWLAYSGSYGYMDPIDIFIMRMDGSDSRKLTSGPKNKGDISWSPDGKTIAYVESYGFPYDICVVDVNSGETQKLTYTKENEISPAWSPDGKFIAYLRWNNDIPHTDFKGLDLMIMNADGSNPRQITDFKTGYSKISWSPDGQRIAFTSYGDCGDIYSVRVDGTDLKRLTDMTECATNSTWSPDGKYIAFEAHKSATQLFDNKLYIMSSDGNNITPIYSWSGPEFRPDWKPVPSLYIGNSYITTPAGNYTNIRSDHSLEAVILHKLETGEVITVLDGPVDADDFYWWKIKTEDGAVGWVVEMFGWYSPNSQ